MMCIPFICLLGLCCKWFSFLLVSPSCTARLEGCGVLCKRQQSFDVFDILLRGMVIPYGYSFLCTIVNCQHDLCCGVHVPYGDVLLR